MSWSKVLKNLLCAVSWRECEYIVYRHPEVLLPKFDEELSIYIGLARSQDPRSARIAKDIQMVLQRCCEIGIESAFDEKVNNAVNEDLSRLLPYPNYSPFWHWFYKR